MPVMADHGAAGLTHFCYFMPGAGLRTLHILTHLFLSNPTRWVSAFFF